jgi:hypothetical protein
MGFSNVIFPELHNWALVTGWCAALLIVSTAFLLMVNLVHRRNSLWQVVIFFLIVAIGIWSLIIALSGYLQWLDIVHHAPAHGLFAYAQAMNEIYLAAVFRCQIQFAVTAVLLVTMLFMLCWAILPYVLHRDGEAKSETLLS